MGEDCRAARKARRGISKSLRCNGTKRVGGGRRGGRSARSTEREHKNKGGNDTEDF